MAGLWSDYLFLLQLPAGHGTAVRIFQNVLHFVPRHHAGTAGHRAVDGAAAVPVRLRLLGAAQGGRHLLPDVPADKKQITIFNLMTHTSGIPSEIFLYKKCTSPDQALDTILNTPLAYPTGKGVAYSCMGYIVLGKIMERISGRPLNVLAKEWTFDPLGMTATCYRPLTECDPDSTIAYTETETLNGPCPPGVVHDENARYLNGISGNAGVFSNLDDMIQFAQMLSKNGAPIMNKRLFDLARVNYTSEYDENRGLGFQLSGPNPTFFGDMFGNDGLGHTGFTGTSLAVDPQTGLYVVLLTNRVHPTRNNNGLMRLRHQIHNAAAAEFM